MRSNDRTTQRNLGRAAAWGSGRSTLFWGQYSHDVMRDEEKRKTFAEHMCVLSNATKTYEYSKESTFVQK